MSDDDTTLRLGGMALRNGLLVHGPSSWAAAVRLAEPHDPAHARDVVGGREPGLAAGRGADLARVVAHRGGPVRRPVDEQAVAERHASEPELSFLDGTHWASSLLGRSVKKSAANARSRRSMRSSSECTSGHVSYRVWWRWGKKP